MVATNASNQVMSGAAVSLSVNNDATIAIDGNVTDTAGKLTGEVGIGDNKNNRVVTVTATANNGTLVRSKTFKIDGSTLNATALPATLATSAAGTVLYTLTDAANNPMVGIPLVITGPGGVESSATTDSNGKFNYSYTAPTTAGDLTILATAAGADNSVTVLVTAGTGAIPPVNPSVSPIRSASVQASPSVVPTNAVGSEANQSQIRALFVTDSNAPVKNIRVYFDLAGDQNSIGGTFNTGTTLVYSDANGVATSTYIPAQRSSWPTDGLTVRACWDYADFTPPACPHSATTTLTVIDDPVSVTIGTDGTLEIGPSGLTYVKRYVVQVDIDSSRPRGRRPSHAVDRRRLRYRKGTWELAGDIWAQFPTAVCDNEDINRNNILEVYSNGGVEDANGNGKLDPRKAERVDHLRRQQQEQFRRPGDREDRIPAELLGSWVDFDILVTAGEGDVDRRPGALQGNLAGAGQGGERQVLRAGLPHQPLQHPRQPDHGGDLARRQVGLALHEPELMPRR
ncbi:MAG: Ig-like domain-containing protein [Rubrivivax sp.]